MNGNSPQTLLQTKHHTKWSVRQPICVRKKKGKALEDETYLKEKLQNRWISLVNEYFSDCLFQFYKEPFQQNHHCLHYF